MAFFTQEYLDFFIELAANNHKDWFDANRSRYEKDVKKPFVNFVQAVIDEISRTHPDFNELTPSECIFRINRDIRFSKDKSPYKLMCSAVVAPQGKKSKSIHGVYFELSPEAVRVYGGIYEIDKDDLYLVREGIAQNLEEFECLISSSDFVQTFGVIQGERNKLVPKQWKKEVEKQPLILNKQFYFVAEYDSALILKEELLNKIIQCFHIGFPIESFFNKFIQRS